MNIQIDTSLKILKLQESINLGELSELLLKLFPNNEWKEYKLETNTIIANWTSPIIIEKNKPYHWRSVPYYIGDLPSTFGANTLTSNNGVCNISTN